MMILIKSVAADHSFLKLNGPFKLHNMFFFKKKIRTFSFLTLLNFLKDHSKIFFKSKIEWSQKKLMDHSILKMNGLQQ